MNEKPKTYDQAELISLREELTIYRLGEQGFVFISNVFYSDVPIVPTRCVTIYNDWTKKGFQGL